MQSRGTPCSNPAKSDSAFTLPQHTVSIYNDLRSQSEAILVSPRSVSTFSPRPKNQILSCTMATTQSSMLPWYCDSSRRTDARTGFYDSAQTGNATLPAEAESRGVHARNNMKEMTDTLDSLSGNERLDRKSLI